MARGRGAQWRAAEDVEKGPHRVERVARAAPCWIVGYFALAALGRATTPGGLGLDEAQIVVHAQRLEWGYGPQPPLYAWLQYGAFALLGEGKLALALVKNAVLATAFVAVWVTARLAGAAPTAALAASLALLFIPGIAWEAQRALTHTPLALAGAAAALAVFTWSRRHDRYAGYAALGLVLGAGLLAKWNVAFVAVAIVATLLLRPPRKWGAAVLVVAIALAVVTPTGLWYLGDWAAAGRAAEGLDLERPPFAAALPLALAALAEGVGATLGLGALVLAAAVAKPPARPAAAAVDSRLRADLTAVLGLSVAGVAVAVLLAGATEVKERWLTPILFAAPLVAVLWSTPRLTVPRVAWVVRAAALIAVAVPLGLQWNWRLGDGEPSPQRAPFAPIAATIREDGSAVLAANDWIGGNLLFAAPGLAVVTPDAAALGVELAHPVQLVWPAAAGAAPPRALVQLYRARFGETPRIVSTTTLAAPFAPPHGATEPFALRRAVVR